MKLKLTRKSSGSSDKSKASSIKVKLSRVSARNQAREMKSVNKPVGVVLKRSNSLPPASDAPASKTVVKVNVSGNMRGMNSAITQTSEHTRKIRAMRKFYNKQMPSLQCNGCSFASSCSQFKAGYECAFLPFLNSHKVETTEDLLHYMKELLAANMRRTHLTMIMETLSGGMPSLETSEALNLAYAQLANLHTKMTESETSSLEIETDDSSIVGRLFGGLDNLLNETKDAANNPIDVQMTKVEDKSEERNLPALTDVREDLVRDFTEKGGIGGDITVSNL